MERFIYLHIAVILIVFTNKIQGNATLQRMLVTEFQMRKYVGDYVQQLDYTVSKVESDLYKLLLLKWSPMDRSDYLNTPLTAMVMVRRLVWDWAPLVTRVGKHTKLQHLQLHDVRWPTTTDMENAARVVMRSQMTYEMNTALLVRGIQSDTSLTNVTAADCLEIALQYFKYRLFPQSTEWLQYALSGIQGGDHRLRETVLYYMAATLCFTGDINGTTRTLREILESNHASKPPKDLTTLYSIMATRGCNPEETGNILKLEEEYHQRKTDTAALEFFLSKRSENHRKLCRGEVKIDHNLCCRYIHYHQPHLRFQPFKLEELQLDPPVVRFYDLITDKEADNLRNTDINEFERSVVFTYDPNVKKPSDFRTCLVAWVETDGVSRLERRIADATRLNTNYRGFNQLVRYSVSGEFLPHRDYMKQGVPYEDDRFATVMFFLNDVDQGGRTVFTIWDLSVLPVKNSAVLWFNFKPNGESEDDSMHSGCPVLKGTKWIINKWVRVKGNHDNFPCTLDQEGTFKGFYL